MAHFPFSSPNPPAQSLPALGPAPSRPAPRSAQPFLARGPASALGPAHPRARPARPGDQRPGRVAPSPPASTHGISHSHLLSLCHAGPARQRPPLPYLPGSATAARDHRRGRRDPYPAAIPGPALLNPSCTPAPPSHPDGAAQTLAAATAQLRRAAALRRR